uniref:uncharacterized protein LOC114595381 n=1 Tax=Podarcis muralis TaxID=64176 RepID=UPI0010A01DA4|nr:uncharacterized protein LOC114595381 [Podarcis muralis]
MTFQVAELQRDGRNWARRPSSLTHTHELGLPASESLSLLVSSRFRRLRRLISCKKVAPLEVLEQPAVSDVLGIHIPSVALLDKDQLQLLGIIQDCQAARLRGLRTLKYSKEETAKAILNILGHLEYFRDRPLSLALAFEALLQLSFMRPHFSLSMVSEILHRTAEAVLGSAEEDKEELKRPFQSLLGGLLLEAPNTRTFLQLLTDLRYYALWGNEDERKLGASSISLLLALSQRFPNLRNKVIRPELACFRNNLKEGNPHTLGTVNSLSLVCPRHTSQVFLLGVLQDLLPAWQAFPTCPGRAAPRLTPATRSGEN